MFGKLKFNLQAKNRHGIHSKFVYDFLDKALYNRSLKACDPEFKLLKAILTHFYPKRIGIDGESVLISDWLRREFESGTSKTGPYDLYVSDYPVEKLESLIHTATLWTPDSIIYVGNIRKTPKYFEIWNSLCNLEVIRVCIETYSSGMLCFRPQQEPQHFNIRLNSSIFDLS